MQPMSRLLLVLAYCVASGVALPVKHHTRLEPPSLERRHDTSKFQKWANKWPRDFVTQLSYLDDVNLKTVVQQITSGLHGLKKSLMDKLCDPNKHTEVGRDYQMPMTRFHMGCTEKSKAQLLFDKMDAAPAKPKKWFDDDDEPSPTGVSKYF